VTSKEELGKKKREEEENRERRGTSVPPKSLG
jgi:hypothetical protein